MKKLSIEVIQTHCIKNDIRLISKEYKTAKRDLEFECLKGHKFKRSWDTFRKTSKCPICIGYSRNKIYHLEQLRLLAKDRQHSCLSKEYKNAHSKYSFKCMIHNHIFSTTATHYKSDRVGCPYCSNKLTQSLIKEKIKKRANQYNYLIINYKEGSKNKSFIKCRCGNELNVLNDNLKRFFTNCKSCSLKGQGLYSEKYFERNPNRKNVKGYLYLVYLKDFDVYKVGITTTKLDIRLRKLPSNKLIKSYSDTIYKLYLLETEILNQFKLKNDYIFSGHTECISSDIDKIIKFADNKLRELGETLNETIPSQAIE